MAALSDEGRERIREANRYRNLRCGKCHGLGTELVDGSRIGGIPGITYRYCPGCGWSTVPRPRRSKADNPLRDAR